MNDKENEPTNNSCLICSQAATKLCSKCKVVYYCSRECQEADWSSHRFFCASLPFPPKVPAKKSINGVLLNPESSTPRLVEVPLIEWHFEGKSSIIPEVEPLIKATFLARNYMEINPFSKKELRDVLVFEYRENFRSDGSKANKWIDNVHKGRQLWRGPVLIYKVKGHDLFMLEQNGYADVNMKDFKDIVDFFKYSHEHLTQNTRNLCSPALMDPVDYDNMFKYDFRSLQLFKN